MTSTLVGDEVLSPELEAIATAAHDRLHAGAGEDLAAAGEAQGRVAEAASAAITAGAPLSAIADAEHTGQLRARRALGADVLKQVTRAAKRKREADAESTSRRSNVLADSGSRTARSLAPRMCPTELSTGP